MKKTSKHWTCPLCLIAIKSQGKGGHLFTKHGIRSEQELAVVMTGQEVKLLPEEPNAGSQTETVTRIQKQVFKKDVSKTPETGVANLETPVQEQLTETPVLQHPSEPLDFERLRQNGTYVCFIKGVFFNGSYTLLDSPKLRELLQLKVADNCYLHYRRNIERGGVEIWRICDKDCENLHSNKTLII